MKKLIVILGILTLITACGGGGGGAVEEEAEAEPEAEAEGGGGAVVEDSITEAQQEQYSVGVLGTVQAVFEASDALEGGDEESLSVKAIVTEACSGGGWVSMTNETLATYSNCVTAIDGWTFTLGGTASVSGAGLEDSFTIVFGLDISATDDSSTLEFSVTGTVNVDTENDLVTYDDMTFTYDDYEYVFAASFLQIFEGVYTGSATVTVDSLVIECEFSAYDMTIATMSSLEALCDFENAS